MNIPLYSTTNLPTYYPDYHHTNLPLINVLCPSASRRQTFHLTPNHTTNVHTRTFPGQLNKTIKLKKDELIYSWCFYGFILDGPYFKTHPVSQKVDFGEDVTLECDVRGNPKPQVIWTHENSNMVSQSQPPYPTSTEKLIKW